MSTRSIPVTPGWPEPAAISTLSATPCPCCDSYAPPEDRGGRRVCPDCGYPTAEAAASEAPDLRLFDEVGILDDAGWQQLLALADQEVG